jgi:hypothetical protein
VHRLSPVRPNLFLTARWCADEAQRRLRVAAAVRLGLYPIVTLEKQILDMIGNLV